MESHFHTYIMSLKHDQLTGNSSGPPSYHYETASHCLNEFYASLAGRAFFKLVEIDSKRSTVVPMETTEKP